MKITGYGLREAIKQQELRRDAAANAFTGCLKKFPNEKKESPNSIMESFSIAERNLATLQVAQMRYNLSVQIDGSEKMTLAEAIKVVGGYGRIEKMWKSTIAEKADRYAYGTPDERNIDEKIVRAERTISSQEAVKLTTTSGKRASSLRAAIAIANGKEIEIEGLDSRLLE
jgi:hypothetical protein